jgi:hypothetical protein
MPKKSKKKTGKKSTKKAVVKKAAKKKATKRATKKAPPARKAPPAKKKSPAKSLSAASGKPQANVQTRTPPLCAENFSASNGDPVNFTGVPSNGTTISQVGAHYPFSPITGYVNGMAYTNLPLPSGQQLLVAAPAINQTYPYDVNTCPGLGGNHSVTVGD